MKLLNNINEELLTILNEYRAWFDEQDDHELLICDERRVQGHTLESATSEEYLNEVKKDSHKGTPEVALVSDFHLTPGVPKKYRDKSLELCTNLAAYLGAKFNAVHVYYPKDGFMGWHNNWDCPGYNILISYSEGDNGFFRYLDPETQEICSMEDIPGWSCKVGYYGGKKEDSSLHYWHCAGSTTPRQTLGFVIPNKEMWEMMIEDIEG